MSKSLIPILLIILILTGCEKDKIPLSGTVTIDNTLQGTTTYYAMGFSFEKAAKVSTLQQQGYDIVITNDGTVSNLILQANNYRDSFSLAGQYNDEAAAKQAFAALTSPVVNNWVVWAYGIRPNQIWIYRTDKDTYAKIRIISTESLARPPRDFAACTFEWAYQPDGTLTFPGK